MRVLLIACICLGLTLAVQAWEELMFPAIFVSHHQQMQQQRRMQQQQMELQRLRHQQNYYYSDPYYYDPPPGTLYSHSVDMGPGPGPAPPPGQYGPSPVKDARWYDNNT